MLQVAFDAVSGALVNNFVVVDGVIVGELVDEREEEVDRSVDEEGVVEVFDRVFMVEVDVLRVLTLQAVVKQPRWKTLASFFDCSLLASGVTNIVEHSSVVSLLVDQALLIQSRIK